MDGENECQNRFIYIKKTEYELMVDQQRERKNLKTGFKKEKKMVNQ